MNRFIIMIISLITVLLFISGCNTTTKSTVSRNLPSQQIKDNSESWDAIPTDKQPSTPSEAVLKYFDSLEKGDISSAKTCLSKAYQEQISDESLKAQSLEYKHNRKNLRIWKESIKEDVSMVNYLYNKVSDDTIIEEVIYVVLEEGIWKINLDTPNPNPFKEKN